MSQLSSLRSLCRTVLAIKVLIVLWRQDSIHKGDEFRNGNQGSEREKGTKVYSQLVFRASKIKYYSSRKDMKWRKGKFKFIHLFRKYLLRTCSLPGTVLGP